MSSDTGSDLILIWSFIVGMEDQTKNGDTGAGVMAISKWSVPVTVLSPWDGIETGMPDWSILAGDKLD